MDDDYESQFDALESELRRRIGDPPADFPQFLDELLRRLRGIPYSVFPIRRVRLLTEAAFQYHLNGRESFKALEPIALAVVLAEQEGDAAQLRRALSIQGGVLSCTRNTPAALQSLLRALDIAEQTRDQLGIAAAWGNIAATFFEATLYTDAKQTFLRANGLASALDRREERVGLQTRALQGLALCGLYLREYAQGLEACEQALAVVALPDDREQEQLRALVESTYVQLLLALNRSADASLHAAEARIFAAKCGSVRAQISAATVTGLVEVYSGNVDGGIAAIAAMREQSQGVSGAYQETLRISVDAYERAGQPERALLMSRHLMMHVRDLHQQAILHRQHAERKSEEIGS